MLVISKPDIMAVHLFIVYCRWMGMYPPPRLKSPQ